MLKILLILSLLIVVLQYEYIRFKHNHHDCLEQRSKDFDLLSRDVCQDMEDRYRFRNEVDCEGAERRQRMGLLSCAFQRWWKDSSVVDMFNTLTGSYWSLLGMILPTILIMLYFRNKYQTEMASYDRMERITDKMYGGERTKKIKDEKLKIKSTDTALAYRN
jgi:hypothetical protein